MERNAALQQPHRLQRAKLGGLRFQSHLLSSSTHLYQIRTLDAVAERQEDATQQIEVDLLHNEDQPLPTKVTVLNQLLTVSQPNARGNIFRGVRRHQNTNEEQVMNQLPRESHGCPHNLVEIEMQLKAQNQRRRNLYLVMGP